MDDTTPTKVPGEQRTRSGAASLFSAAHGYAPYASNRESEGVGGVRKFEAEGVTLILGDCRDVLPVKADYIIADPPYGIAYDASHKKYQKGKDHGAAEWDNEPYDPAPILGMNLPSVIWGGNCFASKLPDNPGWLCWVKINRNGTKIRQAEMELAWSNCVTRSQSYRYSWIGAGMEGETNRVNGGTCHPTQKPVPLMAWCMETIGVPQGATVLDPYMGSGTTGIACIRTGRKFIGIERDPKYFETAVQRVRSELAQGVLPLGGGGGFSPENPSTAEKGHNHVIPEK